MLNNLLVLLQTGGTHRVADLARELDTTPEMVEAMLESLERMGKLQPVERTCGGACGTCSLAGLCAAGNNNRVWTLVE
ncbi:MAG: hypothetical protein JXD18_12940 [Anaerolineae bacterium]|nr:hypothetical protein [Anaerolineae bacterium]